MLTVKHTFKLFDVVNKHFNNEEDSRTFVSEIEEIMENKVDLRMNDFATKKDMVEMNALIRKDMHEMHSSLKLEITDLRSEMKQEISGLRSEMKEEISGLRSEMKEEIGGLRSEMKEEIGGLRAEFNTLRMDFHRLDAGINLNIANSALILEKSQKEQLKWLIGAMVAIMGLAVAVIKLF